MNINMIDASEKSKVLMDKVKYSNPSSDNARIAESMVGYSLDITGKVMENAAYGKEDLKSAEEISAAAGLVDVSQQRNYMAVMSNSMSEEEFSELYKDGINPTHTEIEEAVTSLDKLKAKMAETGQIIEGFNDNLSSADIKEALNIGAAIMPLSDDSMAYMIRNDVEPTIENLYKAEHSAHTDTYKEYGINISKPEINWQELEPQINKIIIEEGLPLDEETMNNAKWLVEKEIPLDGKSLKAMADLKEISLPASEETLLAAIKVSLEEGKTAKEANILVTESYYDKAARVKEEISNLSDNGDITRRRQIEEVRLAMTVEANLTLLRKGISIDTTDLEMLVEDLKKAEEEFYRPLLSNKNLSESGEALNADGIREKIDLFKETIQVVENIKDIPVKSVGDLIKTQNEFNFQNLNNTGLSLKSEYVKAEKSYEALMTAPRADMGDNISKAFRNVDDILKDLNLALSEDNRKSVRILGYSEIQITKENIEEVRSAVKTVQSVIDMMTPHKTLQMIREGHNPLNENLYELERELKKEKPEEKAEKYSEFLVKLEKKGEISESEKKAFIGMYRLFDKIERRDSKVIGKVLAQGEELNLKNLLSAYRTGRFGHVDINVDDEFGMIEEIISKGESITDQIEQGFAEIRKEETPKEYINDKLQMIDEASGNDEAVKILEELELPVNIENILAARDFSERGRVPFKKIFASNNDQAGDLEAKEEIREATKDIIDDFAQGEGQQAYEEFVKKSLVASEKMMSMAETYANAKEWLRLNKQISIAGNMARTNEYQVPVETDEGYISVHLKIKETGSGEGKVEASYNDEVYGEIRAAFSVNGDVVSGIISSRYENGFEMIKGKEENLRNVLIKNGFSLERLNYVKSSTANGLSLSKGETTNKNLFKVAGLFLRSIEKGVVKYEN